MAVIVQKYGGSSVANEDRIRLVAQRVAQTREKGHEVVVVLSAMGDTTDHLLELAHRVSKTPHGRELDMLVTAGERISIALLSMAIWDLGHEAISFTGSQSGIITNHSHNRAQIVEVRPYRIQDELAAGRVVIVAGYQGVSYKREITSLGRGGTDATAVALAAALNAEVCEIYSDVDGIYTADPRVVLDAERLDTITYEEMLELARHGAKVMNADAVAYAQRHGIALYARATAGDPDDPGTIIRLDRPESAPIVTGVTSRKDTTHVEFCAAEGGSLNSSELLAELRTQGVAPDHMQSSDGPDGRFSMIVNSENHTTLDQTLANFTPPEGIRLRARRAVHTVSIVGHGIPEDPQVLTRATEAFNGCNGTVLGTILEPLALTCVLEANSGNDTTEALVQELHSKLIGKV